VLSIADVRRILGRPDLTDEEATELRDSLYVWLNEILDDFFLKARDSGDDSPPPPDAG
jgi:hypothetical protein